MKIGDIYQTADWKAEKHVPVIDAPDTVKADEIFNVTISLGKEIAHPNTTEHHIRQVTLYYKPEGGKFAYQAGHFEFSAHGEDAAGPNQGPIYTNHTVTCSLKLSTSGTLVASSFCNIHGLWESEKAITVES